MQKDRKEIVSGKQKVWGIIVVLTIVFITMLLLATEVILTYMDLKVYPSDYVADNEIFQTNSNIDYWIDYVNISGDLTETVSIMGWASMPESYNWENKFIDIILVSDKKIYTVHTQLTKRIDLPNDGPHQFLGKFSTIQMEDGVYTFFIYCNENTDALGYMCTQYALKKDGREVSLLSDYEGVCQTLPLRSETTTEAPVYHSIDVCQKNGNNLQIRGWAAAIGIPSKETSVLIALIDENEEGYVYNTAQYIRHILRTELNDTIYDQASFYTNIPLSDLEEGTYTLSILVQADTLRLAPLSHKVIYGADGSITFERGTLPASTPKKTYAERQDIPLADFTQNRELYHSIGSCNPVDDVLQVKGWGIEVGTPSAEAEVFIGLTNSAGEGAVYNTEAYAGTYLRDVLENGQIYDNSYFECNIPLSELEPGSYVLEVLVRGRESGRSIVPHALLVKEDGTIEYTP